MSLIKMSLIQISRFIIKYCWKWCTNPLFEFKLNYKERGSSNSSTTETLSRPFTLNSSCPSAETKFDSIWRLPSETGSKSAASNSLDNARETRRVCLPFGRSLVEEYASSQLETEILCAALSVKSRSPWAKSSGSSEVEHSFLWVARYTDDRLQVFDSEFDAF